MLQALIKQILKANFPDGFKVEYFRASDKVCLYHGDQIIKEFTSGQAIAAVNDFFAGRDIKL